MKKGIRKNIKPILIVLLIIIISLISFIGIQLQNQNVELPNISSDIPLQITENQTWTQDKTNVTNGEITLEVGSKITGYEANGVSDWYVLGAENGNLLLTTNFNTEKIRLDHITSNVNGKGVSTLNNAASVYKNSELSTSARSINVDDINRVTGYDTSIHAVDYGKNYFYWYGNNMTYTLGSYTNSAGLKDNLRVIGTKYPTTAKTITTTFNKNRFYYPGSSTTLYSISSGNSKTFKSTLYRYYPQTLSTTASTQTSINGSELAYNLLFTNTNGDNNRYWLAKEYMVTTYGTLAWRVIWSR